MIIGLVSRHPRSRVCYDVGAMDLKRQRHYYNLCKPSEVLDPDDPRYVQIDELGDADHRVRGENWVAKLARRVELSEEPATVLLTGLPGSGKSTELRRLALRLNKADGANLLPVVIDAEEAFDLANPIDIPDIILSILHSIDRTLLFAEGKSGDRTMRESYLERFWNWLKDTDVDIKQGQLAVADPVKLVVELKTRPSLRTRVRQAVASHLSRFLDEACDEILQMQARAEKLGRAGIVVIFDSLEKLRGISSNWEEVLQSAERVFAGGAPYLSRLPVHTFYTIPTALIARRRFEHVLFMPMIKLHLRDGTPFQPGIEAAREIVIRRVPPEVLREVFGEDFEMRVRAMMEWSGGYPRELVRLLQSALSAETLPLSASALVRLFNEVGDQYRRLIPATAFPWLARVAVDQYMTLDDDHHRQTADAMLSNNVVLRYLNDKDWFDLHPAVRTIPGVDAEIRRQRQGRAENASDPGS
jgi:hypothetical protein